MWKKHENQVIMNLMFKLLMCLILEAEQYSYIEHHVHKY